MKRHTAIEIISALLIFLFVYTAASKLLSFDSFSSVLRKIPLLGGKATFIARVLPATELVVSVLLLIPVTRLWGFYGSTILMAAFTLYLGYMIAVTPHLPCSCGGVLKQMTWNQHLIFNIFFLLLSLTGIVLQRKQLRREDMQEPLHLEFS